MYKLLLLYKTGGRLHKRCGNSLCESKRKHYITQFYCPAWERRLMLNNKNRNLNRQHFGDLELVDRELFFICANRRDT